MNSWFLNRSDARCKSACARPSNGRLCFLFVRPECLIAARMIQYVKSIHISNHFSYEINNECATSWLSITFLRGNQVSLLRLATNTDTRPFENTVICSAMFLFYRIELLLMSYIKLAYDNSECLDKPGPDPT